MELNQKAKVAPEGQHTQKKGNSDLGIKNLDAALLGRADALVRPCEIHSMSSFQEFAST